MFHACGKARDLGEAKVHDRVGRRHWLSRLPESKDTMVLRTGRWGKPGGSGGSFSLKAAEGKKAADKLIGLEI